MFFQHFFTRKPGVLNKGRNIYILVCVTDGSMCIHGDVIIKTYIY